MALSIHGYAMQKLIGSGGIASVYLAKLATLPPGGTQQMLAPLPQVNSFPSASPATKENKLVAVKVVPLDVTPTSERSAQQIQSEVKKILREMKIHQSLNHPFIIKLMNYEERGTKVGDWPSGLYLVMELATGGDLFDKITPDVGVPEDIALLFFRQLIAGLKYLGVQGVCHRDIKPENCLISAHGNLKISDFGLATVFRHKGQERQLSERCGSPPYVAPELVEVRPYRAEPVDIWSAGVVLFALLVGNTPWDEPTNRSPEFIAFVDGTLQREDPWTRMSPSVLTLLTSILTLDPAKRATIAQVEKHDWFLQQSQYCDINGMCATPERLAAQMMQRLYANEYVGKPESAFEETVSAGTEEGGVEMVLSQRGRDPQARFTAPLELYSRLSMAASQRATTNLNRFFTPSLDPNQIISTLVLALRALLPERDRTSIQHVLDAGSSWTGEDRSTQRVGKVKFLSKDKRNMYLGGTIYVNRTRLPAMPGGGGGGEGMDLDDDEGGRSSAVLGEEGHVVEFMKKQGDPLEWKRLYKALMTRLPSGFVTVT